MKGEREGGGLREGGIDGWKKGGRGGLGKEEGREG